MIIMIMIMMIIIIIIVPFNFWVYPLINSG
jgi:hypothetical protein